MTRTYYHTTPFSNLESIKEKGLLRGCDGYVYLADSSEGALKFVALRFCKDILVLSIDLEEDLVDESFDHSYEFFKCRAYVYDQDIPLEDIREANLYKLK